MSPTYGPRTTLARVLRLCTPVIPSTRHDSRFLARVTTLHDPFALHTLSLSLSRLSLHLRSKAPSVNLLVTRRWSRHSLSRLDMGVFNCICRCLRCIPIPIWSFFFFFENLGHVNYIIDYTFSIIITFVIIYFGNEWLIIIPILYKIINRVIRYIWYI